MVINCCGQSIEYDAPVTVARFARDLGWQGALCAGIGDETVDLSYVLTQDAEVELYDIDTPQGKTAYNRTCALVLAQAVKSLFPTVKLANGGGDQYGFCYDFDFVSQPSRGALQHIEQEMGRILGADLPYRRVELSRTKALRLMAGFDESYKMEMVDCLPKGTKVSVYYQGDFVNLSRGPVLPSTGQLGAFCLLSMSTAYWQDNKNNKKLRRIYGMGFATETDKQAYLALLKDNKGQAKGVLPHRAANRKK